MDNELLSSALAGEKRAISKLITRIERGGESARRLLESVWPYTGKAKILGITGPPGAGKSTLVNRMASYWRAAGLKIGIIAVDPTSPFTDGAILGDRVRMSDQTMDDGVFVRSMGTRGHLGGLSAACAGAAGILDACGFDLVIIETVGVGQSEIEVVYTADLVVVMAVPGLGDDVQSIKAGILEIGDIFAVNKSDLPGADKVAHELTQMLTLGGVEEYKRDVIMVSAEKNRGVAELCDTIDACYQEMKDDGRLHTRRTLRLRRELLEVVRQEILNRLFSSMNPELSKDFQAFVSRQENPYTWVEEIISSLDSMEGAKK